MEDKCPYKGIYGNYDKDRLECRQCQLRSPKVHYPCRVYTRKLQKDNPFKGENNEKTMAKR